MLRKFPNLTSLDGERLKLKVSAQKALLESMAVPKAAFEVPKSKPWLENFDWEEKNREKNNNDNNKSNERIYHKLLFLFLMMVKFFPLYAEIYWHKLITIQHQ